MIEMTDDAPEQAESETAVSAHEPVTEAAPSAASEGVHAPSMNMGTYVDDSDSKAPVVIIGTGLAGYNLAREFRKLDKTTPLLLISSDDGCSYSRAHVIHRLHQNNTADDLAMADG